MSTYKELQEVIEKMEVDLAKAKKAEQRPFLNDYELGFAEGVAETTEASLSMMKAISHQLSWEETPPRPSADGDWGDTPSLRTGMGG